MLKGKHGAMMGETLYSLLLAIFATTPSGQIKTIEKWREGRDGNTSLLYKFILPHGIYLIVYERTLSQFLAENAT